MARRREILPLHNYVPMIDDHLFFDRNPGLSGDSVASVNSLLQSSFTDEEFERLADVFGEDAVSSLRNARPTIRDLPLAYVELLKLSNGGGITIGDREIAFFNPTVMREYLVAYQIPRYMPGALPFGLNGGGVFYVFDMREPMKASDYPILAAAASNLVYDDAPLRERLLSC